MSHGLLGDSREPAPQPLLFDAGELKAGEEAETRAQIPFLQETNGASPEKLRMRLSEHQVAAKKIIRKNKKPTTHKTSQESRVQDRGNCEQPNRTVTSPDDFASLYFLLHGHFLDLEKKLDALLARRASHVSSTLAGKGMFAPSTQSHESNGIEQKFLPPAWLDFQDVESANEEPPPTVKNYKLLRDKGTRLASFQRRRGRDSDMSARYSMKSKAALTMKQILDSNISELVIGLVCVWSACLVGAEVQWYAHNDCVDCTPLSIVVMNGILTVFFTVELCVKLFVYGRNFFFFNVVWHALDVIIVIGGLVEFAAQNFGTASSDQLEILSVLKVGRIIRLVRLAKIVQFIKDLRMLVISIVATLRSVAWAGLLLLLIMYVFAIVLQQSINDVTDPNLKNTVDTLFGDLFRTMMTLFQTITGGVSWIEVEKILVGLGLQFLLVFIGYFAFTYFAVLNVITGVFCSSALDNAKKDQDSLIASLLDDEQYYTESMRGLFSRLDGNNSGQVSIVEFWEGFAHPEVGALFKTLGIDEMEAAKMFDLYDEDGNGEISCDEFMHGCLTLRGPATRIDQALTMEAAQQILLMQEYSNKRLNHLQKNMRDIKQHLLSMSTTTNGLHAPAFFGACALQATPVDKPMNERNASVATR